ncbi:hypothetical protein QUA70_22365 [Microcoleus sp. LAD1_D5]|uniref:hypothetical protein n=1 Tax=unclassified Microcoleus TaxID=2642155 RepID=UPI002FD40155
MKSFIVRAAAVFGVIATSVLDTLKEEEEKKRLLDSGIIAILRTVFKQPKYHKTRLKKD